MNGDVGLVGQAFLRGLRNNDRAITKLMITSAIDAINFENVDVIKRERRAIGTLYSWACGLM